jgi:hypothetical protein
MSTLNDQATTEATAAKGWESAIGAMLLGLSLAALAVMLPSEAGAHSEAQTAKRVATVATVTTFDFRVAVVAERIGGGTAPTAQVRAAIAQRIGGGWRERRELRLRESYFWRTVTGPRAVCRLEIRTASTPTRRPHVTIQLLQSPSLGCGPTHRLLLPQR